MVKRWIASLDGWPEKKVGQVEVVRASDYDRAIEFLRDIADLAGTTKRKQAGCETAAHALAQLGEERESPSPQEAPHG